MGDLDVVDRAVADGVEKPDEGGVALPVDLLELDEVHGEVRLGEDAGREEVGRFVAGGGEGGRRGVGARAERAAKGERVGGEEALLLARDDRRKLVEIADEDHLQAAEPFLRARTVEAEELLDAVHEVGPDHGHLVDDDGVEVAVEGGAVGGGAPALAELADGVRRDVGLEAEEGVDRLAADVQGGDAGRGQDGDALERLAAPELEEGRFPGPGLAGDEDVLRRPLHDVEGPPEAGIDLDRGAGHRSILLDFRFGCRCEPARRWSGLPDIGKDDGVGPSFSPRISVLAAPSQVPP